MKRLKRLTSADGSPIAALVALIAVAQTGSYLVHLGPSTPDGVGSLLAAYESVSELLLSSGVVGFVNASHDEHFNSMNYYLAQHALAPLIVIRDWGASVQFIVTTSQAPAGAARVVALDGFVLVGTGTRDVHVFRRIR